MQSMKQKQVDAILSILLLGLLDLKSLKKLSDISLYWFTTVQNRNFATFAANFYYLF